MKKYDKIDSGRFIWIDWSLLLLLVGVIVGGVWYWILHTRAADSTEKIEYVLKISGVREQYAAENGGWDALIVQGSQVTTANGTATLGTVIAVESRAHIEPGVRDGAVVFVECAGLCDLYVTVQGYGTSRVGDGIRIAAGGSGDFRIGLFYAPNAAMISVGRG